MPAQLCTHRNPLFLPQQVPLQHLQPLLGPCCFAEGPWLRQIFHLISHPLLSMLFSSQFFLLFAPPFFSFLFSPLVHYSHHLYPQQQPADLVLRSMQLQHEQDTQQAQHATETQLQEPGRTGVRDREQNHPTSSTTFCTPSQYSKSARTGQCQGRSCQTLLEDRSFEAEDSMSRRLGQEFLQAAEKPTPSGSTWSTSARHLVCSPSPNEQHDKLRNQWRLGEP